MAVAAVIAAAMAIVTPMVIAAMAVTAMIVAVRVPPDAARKAYGQKNEGGRRHKVVFHGRDMAIFCRFINAFA